MTLLWKDNFPGNFIKMKY